MQIVDRVNHLAHGFGVQMLVAGKAGSHELGFVGHGGPLRGKEQVSDRHRRVEVQQQQTDEGNQDVGGCVTKLRAADKIGEASPAGGGLAIFTMP